MINDMSVRLEKLMMRLLAHFNRNNWIVRSMGKEKRYSIQVVPSIL
jgi:hypothetical protein